MTWRIEELAVYRHETHEKHSLEFASHGLNVITGPSQTGKSAIIDILDYALMSRSCRIAHGTIRDHVSHIGLLMADEHNKLGVIRPLPAGEAAMNATCQVYAGLADEGLPHPPDKTTWSIDRAKAAISAFTGIQDMALLEGPTTKEGKLERWATNIRHAAPLCYQPQGVIANRHVSFPGMEETFHRRHLLDALPYFVGSVDEETTQDRRRLHGLKRDLRRAQQAGREVDSLKARGLERGQSLWTKANQLGLIDGGRPDSIAELLVDLNKVTATDFDVDTVEAASGFVELSQRQKELDRKMANIRAQLGTLQGFDASRALHDKRLDRYADKLRVVDLLPKPKGHRCAICNGDVAEENLMATHLQNALEEIETARVPPVRLVEMARERESDLRRQLGELQAEARPLRAQVRQAYRSLERGSSDMDRFVEARNLNGRIQEYLDAMTSHQEPNDELAELEEDIARLEAECGDAAIRRLTHGVQESIGERMTELCSSLPVEFTEGAAELDLANLLIKVTRDRNKPKGKRPLHEIGSAANWVSYHVAAALALHEHFGKTKAPVPRVLLIDQPSQAWFPPDPRRSTEGRMEDEDYRDEIANVNKVLHTVQDVANSSVGPQVILMEHARPTNQSWYEPAKEYNWHTGGSLVPSGWIE